MTPSQADREFAVAMQGSIMAKEFRQAVLDGSQDTWRPVQQAMTFRLAAEAAAFEKAAAYIEGKGGVIPGATVFISLITGSNQPCMSGDGRDHLHSHKRRQFDDATSTLATAIRKLAGEKHD